MTRDLAMMIWIISQNEYGCPCDGCQSILFRNFFWDHIQIHYQFVPMIVVVG